MANSPNSAARLPGAWDIDPRRSLAAGAMWLIVALAVTFSVAAAMWVGRIARQNVFEQHVRRLTLETDQLSSDFSQAVSSRLGAVRAARTILQDPGVENHPRGLADVFDELQSAYPDLDWIAVADASGVIVSTQGDLPKGSRVDSSRWFAAGLQGPWLGIVDELPRSSAEAHTPGIDASLLGDMAAPVHDKTGRVVGVIAAHLRWRRTPNHPLRLTDEPDAPGVTRAYVLDSRGMVLIGPDDIRGRPWNGVWVNHRQTVPADSAVAAVAALHAAAEAQRRSRHQHLLAVGQALEVQRGHRGARGIRRYHLPVVDPHSVPRHAANILRSDEHHAAAVEDVGMSGAGCVRLVRQAQRMVRCPPPSQVGGDDPNDAAGFVVHGGRHVAEQGGIGGGRGMCLDGPRDLGGGARRREMVDDAQPRPLQSGGEPAARIDPAAFG